MSRSADVKNNNKMLLSAKQNNHVLNILESTVNDIFLENSVKNLAQYMGGEMTINQPTSEESYAETIKNPMELIFNQTKRILQKKNIPITNNVYEPLNDKLFLEVALTGRYGNYYFTSYHSNTIGMDANTYINSPLQNNTIISNVHKDGNHWTFNANLYPSQMEVLLNDDDNYVSTGIGFDALSSYKKVGYRACRKLVNDYTGLCGGVLIICLSGVTPDICGDELLMEPSNNSSHESLDKYLQYKKKHSYLKNQ